MVCVGRVWPRLRRRARPLTFVIRLGAAHETCDALRSGIGLIAWELMQLTSSALVFDIHDIGATMVGLGLGWFLFAHLTPGASAGAA